MMLGEWRVAIPFLRRSVYPVRRDSLHAVIPAKAGIQGKPYRREGAVVGTNVIARRSRARRHPGETRDPGSPYRREGAAVPTDADDPAKSGLQNRASPDE
jgi:hypothetical protein